MIAEGLGELDKSGIAELTFKGRYKHSGNHVSPIRQSGQLSRFQIAVKDQRIGNFPQTLSARIRQANARERVLPAWCAPLRLARSARLTN